MAVNYVEVKVEEGILRGQQKTSEGLSQIQYYAFQGIPYAKPPVGDLRFQAPQPADPWDGVKDALEDGKPSLQDMMSFGQDIFGDEDCLYLNVFTPELPAENKKLKPVMFSIHGGGFAGGSGGSEMYIPDYFIEHDVIFVSPHYRTGALGFLSLQNDGISGNAGLKDQVQALLWTHKNIKQFGGDPDNITIMGCSGGGASVEFLLLTELTKGLIKQAIIESGSALNPWSINENPRQFAVTLAEQLGYTGSAQDDKALEKFFKSCSAKEIVEKQKNFLSDRERTLILRFSYAPCVEKQGNGQKFITRSPREILESGDFVKVPLISGLCTNEGCICLLFFKSLNEVFDKMNESPDYFLPLNINVPEDKRDEVGKEIKQYFFGDQPVSKDNIGALTNLVGDLAFNRGIIEYQKYFIQNSPLPVYCYGFSYEQSDSYTKKFLNKHLPDVEIKGVPHGSEMSLLFKLKVPNFENPGELSPTDKKYSKIISTMFTTFAKSGNPNYNEMEFQKWEPAVLSEAQFLDIGQELKMVPGRLHEERQQFWDKLYKKYGYLF